MENNRFYIRSVGGESGEGRGGDLWMDSTEAEYDLDLEVQSLQQDLGLVKAARAALEQVEETLIQMRRLVLEAAGAEESRRRRIEEELKLLEQAIDEIVASANYNGLNLLDGSMGDLGAIIQAILSSLDG